LSGIQNTLLKYWKSSRYKEQTSWFSFDLISLFTNVPVNEALQVIRNSLSLDDTLPNWSSLKVEDIMELLRGLCKNHILPGGR
jgi:hypothetical protein